jgi:hypothetical protein
MDQGPTQRSGSVIAVAADARHTIECLLADRPHNINEGCQWQHFENKWANVAEAANTRVN